MLKKPGIIAEIDAHLMTIDVPPAKSCDTCETHCGLKRGFGQQLIVATQPSLAVGDQVWIGIEETTLLRAAIGVYLIPLMSLGIAALAYEGFVTLTQLPHREYFSILSGFLGFWGGLAGIRQLQFFQPVILRNNLLINEARE